jgi:type VI secretion system secreted protein Hcp
MKFGSTVKGSVTEDKHKEWIELNSFQWGVGRSIATPVGHAANRETSSPSVSEIVVTKHMDYSSVGLMQAALGGEDPVEATLEFVQTSGSKGEQRVFLKFVLTNTLISGFSMSSGGDRPSESITLNFTKIHEEFTPTKEENKPGTAPKVDYDLSLAKLTS